MHIICVFDAQHLSSEFFLYLENLVFAQRKFAFLLLLREKLIISASRSVGEVIHQLRLSIFGEHQVLTHCKYATGDINKVFIDAHYDAYSVNYRDLQ